MPGGPFLKEISPVRACARVWMHATVREGGRARAGGAGRDGAQEREGGGTGKLARYGVPGGCHPRGSEPGQRWMFGQFCLEDAVLPAIMVSTNPGN